MSEGLNHSEAYRTKGMCVFICMNTQNPGKKGRIILWSKTEMEGLQVNRYSLMLCSFHKAKQQPCSWHTTAFSHTWIIARSLLRNEEDHHTKTWWHFGLKVLFTRNLRVLSRASDTSCFRKSQLQVCLYLESHPRICFMRSLMQLPIF